MKQTMLALAIAAAAFSQTQAAPAKKSPKEALQAFQDLIGSWKGTGTPLVGSREDREKGFWQEKIAWQWQFKEKDVWLLADLTKGNKYFSKFEVRYSPDKDSYLLTATTTEKAAHKFEGKLEKTTLTFERSDQKTKRGERLIFALNHSNSHVIYYEERPADSRAFNRLYRVFCRKDGVPFASEDKGPECIVSGGKGTMAVTHNGKTYYVCCTGCREAFKDEPEKYIKEYEDAQKKKKKD